VKAAKVELVSYERPAAATSPSCRGDVAGGEGGGGCRPIAAGRVGEVVTVHVIARPHANVDTVMPLAGRKRPRASCRPGRRPRLRVLSAPFSHLCSGDLRLSPALRHSSGRPEAHEGRADGKRRGHPQPGAPPCRRGGRMTLARWSVRSSPRGRSRPSRGCGSCSSVSWTPKGRRPAGFVVAADAVGAGPAKWCSWRRAAPRGRRRPRTTPVDAVIMADCRHVGSRPGDEVQEVTGGLLRHSVLNMEPPASARGKPMTRLSTGHRGHRADDRGRDRGRALCLRPFGQAQGRRLSRRIWASSRPSTRRRGPRRPHSRCSRRSR